MPRIRRTITIDDKIEQQKAIVLKAKDKYDAALAELERLEKKNDEVKNEELLKAITLSSKSVDEILAFLKGGNDENKSDS